MLRIIPSARNDFRTSCVHVAAVGSLSPGREFRADKGRDRPATSIAFAAAQWNAVNGSESGDSDADSSASRELKAGHLAAPWPQLFPGVASENHQTKG